MSERITTLMREGIERTDPAKGLLFSPVIESPCVADEACAWGCVIVGFDRRVHGTDPDDPPIHRRVMHIKNLLSNLQDTEIKPEHHPNVSPQGTDDQMGRRPLGIANVVTRLNDVHDWTRDDIAQYLDTLIDEHGYNLNIELEPVTDTTTT